MNRFFIILIILLFIGCRNEKTRTVHIPEFGWSLPLPLDMNFTDSAFDNTGKIRDSLWEQDSPSDRPRIELFWIKTDLTNYLNVVVYIDSTPIPAWEKSTIKDSRFYFSIIAGAPEVRVIDTSLSVQELDDIKFQKEYIKYRKKRNDTSSSYQFSRRYKNYSIYINLRFTNQKIGNRYLGMLKRSEFEN